MLETTGRAPTIVRRRRDGTGLFYDILFVARRGETKTQIRRKLGLAFRRAEERVEFLLERGLLRIERNDREGKKLVTTLKGYGLMYFMSVVDEQLGAFFPSRKGRSFERERGIGGRTGNDGANIQSCPAKRSSSR